MQRVCLISPGHLSSNPRLVKEARALKAAGFEVSVIHGQYSRWGKENDIPIAKEIDTTVSVSFGPVEASRLSYFRQSILRFGARRLVQSNCTNLSVVEAAHHPLARDLIGAALSVPADLYIAHYVAAIPAAAKAARHHGSIFAFDAEDFHLGDLPDAPENELEKMIIQTIEGRYLPSAAYVSAASPMIARAYAETYGIALPSTILNVFPKRNSPLVPTRNGSAQPGPSLYWFSQTIGPGRGLEVALAAISHTTSKPHIYLRGTAAPGYREQLFRLAKKVGVADRLHFLEPAVPDELERLGGSYDLGFVGEVPETRNRTIALTNKLFSYAIGGVPCLATQIPAHEGVADEFGPAMSLFAANDPLDLAAKIDALLLDPDRLAAARLHAWQLGQQRFNWDREQVGFLHIMQRALAIKGGRQ